MRDGLFVDIPVVVGISGQVVSSIVVQIGGSVVVHSQGSGSAIVQCTLSSVKNCVGELL